jgi:mannose-1-phosphate guanylyltransferase
MKAMILAAGKGTRVRPITHTTPKPMIPIMQKPVMEFLLELLRQHGFNQIMVNVSHLSEEIENYFVMANGLEFRLHIALKAVLKMASSLEMPLDPQAV